MCPLQDNQAKTTCQTTIKKRPDGQAKTNTPDNKGKSPKIKKETIKKGIKDKKDEGLHKMPLYGPTGC